MNSYRSKFLSRINFEDNGASSNCTSYSCTLCSEILVGAVLTQNIPDCIEDLHWDQNVSS